MQQIKKTIISLLIACGMIFAGFDLPLQAADEYDLVDDHDRKGYRLAGGSSRYGHGGIHYGLPWDLISAMGWIILLPIIIFVAIFEKQIMDGIMTGGVKA